MSKFLHFVFRRPSRLLTSETSRLIRANGKYHGLWSKQVQVKATDGRARSMSPKKRDTELINDLTPSRQKVELAKIIKKKTVAHEEPATHGDSTEQTANESEPAPVDTKSGVSLPTEPTPKELNREVCAEDS